MNGGEYHKTVVFNDRVVIVREGLANGGGMEGQFAEKASEREEASGKGGELFEVCEALLSVVVVFDEIISIGALEDVGEHGVRV